MTMEKSPSASHNFIGTRALVVGLAREGTALTRFLVERGARVTVTDVKPAGALADSVAALADLPVSFHQPHTSVWFDEAMLSTPLPAFDTSHCPPADEQERTSFVSSAPAADLAGQLEQAIESALGHSKMSLGLTAVIIGTSPRTLQRRLAERGSSFSHVHQGVRFRNAQRLLEDPRVPLATVSAETVDFRLLVSVVHASALHWSGGLSISTMRLGIASGSRGIRRRSP